MSIKQCATFAFAAVALILSSCDSYMPNRNDTTSTINLKRGSELLIGNCENAALSDKINPFLGSDGSTWRVVNQDSVRLIYCQKPRAKPMQIWVMASPIEGATHQLYFGEHGDSAVLRSINPAKN
jgi:hypothetical protein